MAAAIPIALMMGLVSGALFRLANSTWAIDGRVSVSPEVLSGVKRVRDQLEVESGASGAIAVLDSAL